VFFSPHLSKPLAPPPPQILHKLKEQNCFHYTDDVAQKGKMATSHSFSLQALPTVESVHKFGVNSKYIGWSRGSVRQDRHKSNMDWV
jgi:hypothetical protein